MMMNIPGLLSEDEKQGINQGALLNAALSLIGNRSGRGLAGAANAAASGLGAYQAAQQQGLRGVLQAKQLQQQMEEAQQKKLMQQRLGEMFASTTDAPESKFNAYMNAANLAAAQGNSEAAKRYADIAQQFRPKDAETVMVDVGGRQMLVNKQTGQPVAQFDKTVTPGEMLTDQRTRTEGALNRDLTRSEGAAGRAVTMRGQNMTDSRAQERIQLERPNAQVINDPDRGLGVIDKNTGLFRPAVGMDGVPVAPASQIKREAAANALLPVLKEAEKLIPAATGSYIGAGVDAGARVFGGSTPGAQSAAKLKVLEGQIIMSQPRMEGPQSNADTQLYRQMAAQIGDDTVPAQTKAAALNTLRQLHEKYAPGGGQGSVSSSPFPTIDDITKELSRRGR